MGLAVETGLSEEIERQTAAIEEGVLAARVSNALLLAQTMRVDITQPLEAQKVLRHLRSVEQYVRSDVA